MNLIKAVLNQLEGKVRKDLSYRFITIFQKLLNLTSENSRRTKFPPVKKVNNAVI